MVSDILLCGSGSMPVPRMRKTSGGPGTGIPPLSHTETSEGDPCLQLHIPAHKRRRIARSSVSSVVSSAFLSAAQRLPPKHCATTVQQKRLVGAAKVSETPMDCEQETSVSERYTGVLAERRDSITAITCKRR